jgi:homoserine kinase
MTIDEGTEIVVPGSISNLGPGFDALSVAIRLYLRVRVVGRLPTPADTLVTEFIGLRPLDDNRIETAFRLARARCGTIVPGLRIQVRSEIPARAGLGSSGAATVAGLRLYAAATSPIAEADMLALACEVDGHPDNAAASLLGGVTVSCQLDDGRITARAWPWPAPIRFVVATPQLELDTGLSRRRLPREVGLSDAVFNLQRALLLVKALDTGRYEDLREALRDRWHQPARAPLVPGLAEALAIDDPAVLGVCLSGAGPSIVALATDGAARAAALLENVYRSLGVPCTIRTLEGHQPHADAS